MDPYTACEQAYRKGYEDGRKAMAAKSTWKDKPNSKTCNGSHGMSQIEAALILQEQIELIKKDCSDTACLAGYLQALEIAVDVLTGVVPEPKGVL